MVTGISSSHGPINVSVKQLLHGEFSQSVMKEREEGQVKMGTEARKKNTKAVLSCVLQPVSYTQRRCCRTCTFLFLLYILSIHNTLNKSECVAADQVALINMYLTVD